MKKIFTTYLLALLILSLISGVTLAAFTDKASILGASFSVGSSDIKLLKDLALGVLDTNLADELEGAEFNDLGPNWTQDYPLKIYNNSTSNVLITSNANYETSNDPDDLRQEIYVEPISWDDINNNGVVEESELGTVLDKKTIVKWKTEGYAFGELQSGQVLGVVLRFSTANLAESKQGSSAVFDFEFDSLGL